MSSNGASQLNQAIVLAKSGDKDAARGVLRQVTAEKPDNEHAWGWLAYCAENDAEKRRALEQVVRINPDNARAREELEKMGAAAADTGDWMDMIAQEPAPEPTPEPAPKEETKRAVIDKDEKADKEAAKPKRITVGRVFLYLLVTALVLFLMWYFFFYEAPDFNSGSSNGSSTGSRSREPIIKSYSIRYRVDGTAYYASLTYENESENTEQKDSVPLPWELEFEARPGQFLYISAQNKGERGSISCEIVQDGKIMEEAESSGGYVIASCSGSAGD